MIRHAIRVFTLLALAALGTTAAQAQCRDPWVAKAVQQVKHRQAYGSGENGECNINLYGAHWTSYSDLLEIVQQTMSALQQAGLEFNSNGLTIHDLKYFDNILSQGWAGPASQVPSGKNWHINLPGGYVFAINRRCAPGYAAAGVGSSGGCTKGSPR